MIVLHELDEPTSYEKEKGSVDYSNGKLTMKSEMNSMQENNVELRLLMHSLPWTT